MNARCCIATITLALFGTSPCAKAQAPTPDDFTRREVVFMDGKTRLAGTLFEPKSGAPYPAAVLLGGAERGPRTALKERMAQAFAGKGVAVLTYDSPGSGGSSGNARLQTRAARAGEAIAGVRFLKTQKGVSADRVGLWGVSEGACIALLAAGGNTDVAFVIAVSGPFGISPLEQLRYRIQTQCLRKGLVLEQVQEGLLFGEVLFAMLAGPGVVEWPLLETRAKRWPDRPWSDLMTFARTCRADLADQEWNRRWVAFGKAARHWKATPWYSTVVIEPERIERLLSLEARDIRPYLIAAPLSSGDFFASWAEHSGLLTVTCPVMAVWGSEDSFVPPSRSSVALRTFAHAAGKDVTIRVLDGASHVLTRGGPQTPFAKGYPDLLVRWLARRFPRRK